MTICSFMHEYALLHTAEYKCILCESKQLHLLVLSVDSGNFSEPVTVTCYCTAVLLGCCTRRACGSGTRISAKSCAQGGRLALFLSDRWHGWSSVARSPARCPERGEFCAFEFIPGDKASHSIPGTPAASTMAGKEDKQGENAEG